MKYADTFLTADDPKTVVDAIEEMIGLRPNDNKLPQTTAPILTSRVISVITEQFILSRSEVEWKCAWFDSSGEQCAVRDFTGVAYKIKTNQKIDFYNSYIVEKKRINRIVEQILN